MLLHETPTPAENIGDVNIERLVGTAYCPEPPDPAFVQIVEEHLLFTAHQLAASRGDRLVTGPGDTDRLPTGPHKVQRRLAWAVTMAAAVMIGIVAWYATFRLGNKSVFPSVQVSSTESDTVPVESAETDHHRLTPLPRPIAQEAKPLAVGQTLTTKSGERRRVTLIDGSVLFVNQNTEVKQVAARRLQLRRGEVYLEVVPRAATENSTDPTFVVTTPDREVSALGTRFAVEAEKNDTGVLVTQGKVKVSGVEPVVEAGQQLPAGSQTIVPAARASHLLDWTRELMAAAESPLVPASKHAGGAIVAMNPSGQEVQLTLRKFLIDVHIEDGFARTTIDQTYFNNEYSRLEGTFYFPLPADATLSRLAMYVEQGGSCKLNEGGMAERDEARQVYETIRYTNRDPALLEWIDGSTFKMRVFPLEARKEKRIILSYTQRLAGMYGTQKYRFPAGHSMNQVKDWTFQANIKNGGKLRGSSHPNMKLTATGNDLLCRTGFLARPSGSLPGKSPNSQLPKLDAAAHATMDGLGSPSYATRDVTLDIADPGQSDLPRFSSFVQDDQQYLMLRYRPTLTGQPKRERRDWVFLFESGANRDPLLARAQIEVIRSLLLNVEHDDTFSILTAGTRVHLFDKEPRRATPKNVEEATRFLEGTHLIGALDLEKALQTAAPILTQAKNPHLVHVGAGLAAMGELREDVLARLIPEKVRYVGVGVGKRWSRAFMKAAAERTHGHFTQINPDESIAWRSFDLLAALNTPRLLDVRAACGVAPDATPQAGFLTEATSLCQGEELCAIARFSANQPPPEKIIVSGKLDGQPFTKEIRIANVSGNAGYLPRQWAKLEIERLLAEDSQKNKPAIIALSKASYVMSPFTSLLVLETEEDYARFKVDRGRKDHWALYDCLNQIPIVEEYPASRERKLPEEAGGQATSPYRTQVRFTGPLGTKIHWFTTNDDGKGATVKTIEPPGSSNFRPGKLQLKLTEIKERPELDVYPTMEVMAANTRSEKFLSESCVPVEFTREDFKLVAAGKSLVKVTYLPYPQIQDLPAPGTEEILSTRLDPGADPIKEASRRGTVLLVVRMGKAEQEANDWPKPKPDDVLQTILVRVPPRIVAGSDQAGYAPRSMTALGSYGIVDDFLVTFSGSNLTAQSDRIRILAQNPFVGSGAVKHDLRFLAQYQPVGFGTGLIPTGSGKLLNGTGKFANKSSLQSLAGDHFNDWTVGLALNTPRILMQQHQKIAEWNGRYESAAEEVGTYEKVMQAYRDEVRMGRLVPLSDLVVLSEQLSAANLKLSDAIAGYSNSLARFEWAKRSLLEFAPAIVKSTKEWATPNSPAPIPNPLYSTRLSLGVEQPFGREFGNDWVQYYKNHGYQISNGGTQRIQFAPVFVSPGMQWAVPNKLQYAPPSGAQDGSRPEMSEARIKYYLEHPPRYMPPAPLFPLSREMQSLREGYSYPTPTDAENIHADVLYRRPTVTVDPRLFNELPLYAPGLNTNDTDIQAVLATESSLASNNRTGKIDAAARALIDKARSLGWSTLTFGDVKFHVSGAGQYAFQRTLASGLGEQVSCDGKTLLHLYPEIGLGAKRTVSRVYRAELAQMIPWHVLSAEDLALGADVKLVDERTVALVPQDSLQGGVRGGSNATNPPSPWQVHLVFAKDGRLSERRLIEMKSGKALYRETYGADGTIECHGEKTVTYKLDRGTGFLARPAGASGSKDVDAGRVETDGLGSPSHAPNLAPDVSKLVLVPMPLRTPEHLFKSAIDSYAQLDADVVISLIAAYCLKDQGGKALQAFGERFHAKGDRRIGFYTLLASAPYFDPPAGSTVLGQVPGVYPYPPQNPFDQVPGANLPPIPYSPGSTGPGPGPGLAATVIDGIKFNTPYRWYQTETKFNILAEHPKNPLAGYLAHLNKIRLEGKHTEPMRLTGVVKDSFLMRQAEFYDQYKQLEQACAGPAIIAQRKAQCKLAVEYVKSCPSALHAWIMLDKLQRAGQADNADLQRAISDVGKRFGDSLGLAYSIRYEQARTLLQTGNGELARKLFGELYADALSEGALPCLDADFVKALRGSPKDADEFAELVRKTSAKLVQEKRPYAGLLFTWQLWQLGEKTLAGEVFGKTMPADPGANVGLSLAGIDYLCATSQWAPAETLVQKLLDNVGQDSDPDRAMDAVRIGILTHGDAHLWRLAGKLAEKRGALRRVVECQEKALDLDFKNLPETVNVEAVRQEFGDLLGKYQQLAQASVALGSEPLADLAPKVVRLADRWRLLDPEADKACTQAAKILKLLGANDLAWDYLTTPIGMKPHEASPWLTLAQSLKEDGQLEQADNAYAQAFKCEATNAQILWDRATNLQQLGRTDQARQLYRQLSDSTWQPRFADVQSRARLQMQGN